MGVTIQAAPPESAAPHDRLAEQRVIGALLIDRDAIFKVADVLRPADFFVPAHERIYSSALALLERRERIDPLTIQVELARREVLDQVGGPRYLAELAEVVPTAVDVEQHARQVRDRSVMRGLLGAARAIAADAYGEPTDTALALDRAEQRIFALRDEATSAQLRHILPALLQNYEHLTERMEHPFELSGVPSGFREIDGYTEGFTPGDLIIIAARPSVGKTSLGLAIAYNAAKRGENTLLFSLEMDTKQIVARFLGLNSRNDLLALRTGLMDPEAATALMELPVLIDDTPGISIMELRTKARRATAYGRLGLIVIDYLQLVLTGEREENRVQEIATISRNLKSLARELHVPIIALSQLSRAAGDAGHEPKLSTLRECVTGDTLVCLTDGRRIPIRNLVGTTPEVWSVDNAGRIVDASSDAVWCVGARPVIKVRLASGRSIRATGPHRLMTLEGWARLEHLRPNDRIAIARRIPEPIATERWPEEQVGLLGQLIGDGSYLSNAPMRYTTNSVENSAFVAHAAATAFGAKVTCIRGKGSWHQLLISGNGNRWHPSGVNAWLRSLGIFGRRSHEKRIPETAFRLANDQIALLLRHLWATDGSLCARSGRGGHGVYYATNSPGLAADVAALLLRLGIVTRTTRVKKEGYRDGFQIHVSGGADQRRFIDIVGAFGPRVGPATLLRELLEPVRPNTNVDTLPVSAFDRVRCAMLERGIAQRAMATLRGTAYGGSAHFKFAPSRTLLANYAALLNDDVLAEWATNDLFWDRIVAIEADGEEEVFDLTVPGPSSWLADGVISHNSGSLEQDADQVIMLWKDKEDTAPGAPRLIHGSVAKNRNGPTGSFDLFFEPEQARFFSRADDSGMPV